jgi:hypothetical protein
VPDLDPTPIPNIVLHPGDTIATGAHTGDTNVSYIRLLDRHGVAYALLDCERDVAGHGWLIRAIWFFSRRQLLPVRPQPDADTLTLTNYAPPVTISVDATADPYAYTVTHYHSHNHAGPDADDLPHYHSHNHTGPDADDLPHAHSHSHIGADAHRAGQYGHARDPHSHAH